MAEFPFARLASSVGPRMLERQATRSVLIVHRESRAAFHVAPGWFLNAAVVLFAERSAERSQRASNTAE